MSSEPEESIIGNAERLIRRDSWTATPEPSASHETNNDIQMLSLPQYRSARQSRAQSSVLKRRIVIYLALFLGLSLAAFMVMNRSAEAADGRILADGEDGKDHYGTNAHPGFKDLIQLLDLPPNYLPETGKHRQPGRLVVVGDVHGMKDSLVSLLDKIGFNKKKDHLILAGDMISKGPDSLGVVDLAMELGASAVRGNHEDRILLTHADMMAEHAAIDQTGPSEDRDKVEDTLEEESFSHGDYNDRTLVKALGENRIKWLKNCPVILRVGKLEKIGDVVVVHAGLVPGVQLEKQDPLMVMNMRTIGGDGVPSNERNGSGWSKVWNRYQKTLAKKDRTTVIYGHDAKRGLHIEKYSMGIDAGCVKGGALTAMVIEGGKSDHTYKLVHVKCKDGTVA